MKPSMTIIKYLYTGCKTWLRCSEECICDPETLIESTLNQVPVELWIEIDVLGDGVSSEYIERTDEEWNEICGPAAEAEVLQRQLDQHMKVASQIIEYQATKERLSSE